MEDNDETEDGNQSGVPSGGATAASVFAVEGSRTDYVQGTNHPGNIRLALGQTFTFDPADAIDDSDATSHATDNLLNNKIDSYYVSVPTATVASLSASPRTDLLVDGQPSDDATMTNRLPVGNNSMVTITPNAVGTVVVTVTAEDTATASPAGDGNSTYTFTVTVVAGPTLVAGSNNPNTNTRYTVSFMAQTLLNPGDDIVIEMEDFDLPSGLLANRINLQTDAYYGTADNEYIGLNALDGSSLYGDDGVRDAIGGAYRAGIVNPQDALVDGEDLRLTVPDMNPETDRTDEIMPGDIVTIGITQGAGISNPSEGDTYSVKINDTVGSAELETNTIPVVRRVVLSEEDGGRGTEVTATGSGFKNGTTLGFFLDANEDADGNPTPNGIRDAGEEVLCDVAQIGSNDVGSCTFTVSNPPFRPGDNFVGALDGRSQYANKSTTHNDSKQKFELKPSITATPSSGNPGETILVQGYDFPQGTVGRVQLARQNRNAAGATNLQGLAGDVTGTLTVGMNGDLNFRLIIPNWAAEGVQDLRVTVGGMVNNRGTEEDTTDDTYDGGSSDNINITVGGPRITVTPTTVLANQRISLVGTGFTPNSRIAGGNGGTANPMIAIGGYVIPVANINEGDPVTVDNGGKWSASLDMPLRDVTTRDGAREIRVRDSGGRSGSVDINIPAREVTIDPASGRIGTTATVRGVNFPSKNDNGESFNISIAYDAGGGNRPTTVSTVSDASGRFETEIRVPTSATIPSTNTVRVTFEDEANVEVTTTVTHEVPEGNLVLSESSGAPGSTITLRGEGFKTFVPIRSVRIGSIDVIPSPAPATDAQGMTEFDILIPGLDTGIQTIEVEVSDTTASIGFTVTASDEIGAETRVADGVANLGDNFVRAFNFSNVTKSWTFYDPAAGDASTMSHFIAGSSYWILVGQTQEVILNRETRHLTCVDGNCWNLVVW